MNTEEYNNIFDSIYRRDFIPENIVEFSRGSSASKQSNGRLERNKMLVSLYFGGKSLKDCANMFGISGSEARRIVYNCISRYIRKTHDNDDCFCGASVRLRNCLKSQGINSIQEVEAIGLNAVIKMKIPAFGRSCANELERILEK